MRRFRNAGIIFSISLVLCACTRKGADQNSVAEMTETDSITKPEAKDQPVEACYNPNMVKDTTKKSIKSIAVGAINGDSIKINYHSPGVRKRVIWGGLVPFDEVWVTGAHDATTIEFNRPLTFGGKEIPAGKYAIFTIPGRNEWTVIINKDWEQHLAVEYDEAQDLVRIKVKPDKNEHTERLQYFIEDKGKGKGSIAVAWERLRISFDVSAG